MDFSGKTVLVTGSSRHTGLGIARTFLRAGARVGINSASPGNVAKAVRELRDEGFDGMFDAAGDVSTDEGAAGMVGRALEATGRLDALVNNACHLGVGFDFMSTTADFWDEVMGVNARGVFLCSRHAAGAMLKSGGGSIVNISSTCATRALRKRSAYCASKGAVDSLTKAMALELASENIRVNGISLGYVRTSRWEALPSGVEERRRLNVPLGRAVEYEDVGQMAMFLASPLSACVTGETYTLDGGSAAQLYPADCEI